MSDFEIKILEQKWLSDDNKTSDLCSHGRFKLKIADVEILSEQSDIEWTISTSTLKLLRSIESDHLANKDFEIILHCGGLLMMSCPIGIYLDLKHNENIIEISNVKKHYGVGESEVHIFKDLRIEIEKREYAMEILNLAEEVRSFFAKSANKIIKDEFDNRLRDNFWEEFNELYKNGDRKYR